MVPEKQGLKLADEKTTEPSERCLSSGSRKTRIETLVLTGVACFFVGLSSGSRKTRIETRAVFIIGGLTDGV